MVGRSLMRNGLDWLAGKLGVWSVQRRGGLPISINEVRRLETLGLKELAGPKA